MKCLGFLLKTIWFPQTNLVSSQKTPVLTNFYLNPTKYISLDDGFEVRGVFLDISKAFDKVWHKGIIFKLKQNGISGKLLSVLSDFLKDPKQRVILNGQVSSWAAVNTGVPQGSILSHLLFLIYMNDLVGGLS